MHAGVESPPAVWSAPRAEVLDRYSGHTVLCPDSMAAYKTAQRAQSVLSMAAGLGSAAAVSYAAAASTTGSLQAGLLAKYGLPASTVHEQALPVVLLFCLGMSTGAV